MTTTQKMFYTIGEVSKMFNVSTSLIRFWENNFEIIKPAKNNKGNRLFTQKDIDNFHKIYYLVKEKGYTLQGAKDELKNKTSEMNNEIEIVKKLKNVKKFLLELKETLD